MVRGVAAGADGAGLGRSVELALLPGAGKVLERLSSVVQDHKGQKLKRRVEAQRCLGALHEVVGEYMYRREAEPPLALPGKPLPDLSGLWDEALLPYSAQSGRLPEHLYTL
jgi:hypothetical protein